MNKLLERIIAVLLVMTIAGANLVMLGTYSYALTDSQISEQNTSTQNSNVEFNSSFYGGEHIKTENVDSNELKLYLNIKVKNAGYLKNATVTFNDANFKIDKSFANEKVQSIDIENNKIVLKQLNNGEDVIIEVPIVLLNKDKVSKDNFSKETKTNFAGTYVDGSGKEKSVSKEIVNKLSWNGTDEVELSQELVTFNPYINYGNYGVMLRVKVKAKTQNNKLPIQTNTMNITVPTINNMKPNNVYVIANNTKATNGEKDGLEFKTENYSYDAETGKVTITVNNEKNEISWLKEVSDEYMVTFIYEGQEIYDFARANGIDTNITTNAKLKLYNDIETIKEKTIVTELKSTETIGHLADFDMEISSVGKGYLYANYETTKKVETPYYTKYAAIVTVADLVNDIQFKQSIDKFITKNGEEKLTTVSGENYTYNKAVKVNEKVFMKILGQEGSIEVLDVDGKSLGVINKDSAKDENGDLLLDVSSLDNNQLSIKTSKPIMEGKFEIVFDKAIKGNIGYTKEQVKDFERIEAICDLSVGIESINTSMKNELIEPKTVVDLEISKKDLSTVVKNENVEIRAILDLSNIEYALYTNPTLKIKLPSYISKVDLKSSDIVMANTGLDIEKAEVVQENGIQVINVTIKGKQTEYAVGAEYKGVIVSLKTDLTVESLTPTTTGTVTMTYTNNNDVATDKEGTVYEEINFVAPAGLVAANGISNYSEGKQDIMSISDEKLTAKMDPYAALRTAKVFGKIINNYPNDIENVVILGRMPVKDAKKIDTDTSLDATFDTILKNSITLTGIDQSKYTIYYSNNVNATKDLANANNGWSQTATTSTKSYLIVMKDYKMPAGARIEFSYNVDIPANLKHNNQVYEMYKVYYDNNSDIGTIQETKVSPIIGIATGDGPELEVKLSSVLPTEYVREGQVIKMKASIKNVGKVVAENVNLIVDAPEYTELAKYNVASAITPIGAEQQTLSVGTIKVGETKEVIYYIKVKDDTRIEVPDVEDGELSNEQLLEIMEKNKFPKTIVNIAKVTVKDLKNPIQSEKHEITLNKGSVAVDLIGSSIENVILRNNENMIFKIPVRRIGANANNAVLQIQLPNGMEYKNAVIKNSVIDKEGTTQGISYDKNTNILQISLGNIASEKYIELNLNTGSANGKFQLFAKVKTDDMPDSYSNVLEYEIKKAEVSISELTSTPKYVKEKKEITYKIKVANKSQLILQNVDIIDELPQGVSFVEASYEYLGETLKIDYIEGQKLEVRIPRLESGEEKEIKIVVSADLLPDEKDKEIQNHVTVSALGGDKLTSNTVTNIIEYDPNAHIKDDGDDKEDPKPIEKRYKITGTAWIDANKDGKRDNDEPILPNVPVILINKSNNTIVFDPDTKAEKRTVTGQDGKYTFENLVPNEYLVVFLYDASKYSLTKYQEKDVVQEFNSDVIDINITLDGERRIAGITDIVKITDSNARDIDIGVYSSEKFDLRLDKYVSKMTLTTPTIGTKTYNYDNNSVAKVEVLGQNLGKSNVVIEYKLVIKNEGAVPGYAKKIIDYLPKELKFNTELNKDWYLASNGNLYNTSLANEIINPGESKELTLVVTKKITEDSIGIIQNKAEIYESYNELGLKDMDSTPGNEVEGEDDFSKADVIVSIVTGKIILYTSIGLTVIVMLGFGIYEIKKRVLNRNKRN